MRVMWRFGQSPIGVLVSRVSVVRCGYVGGLAVTVSMIGAALVACYGRLPAEWRMCAMEHYGGCPPRRWSGRVV
eukprot:91123-Prymnesium_polylepis.1